MREILRNENQRDNLSDLENQGDTAQGAKNGK